MQERDGNSLQNQLEMLTEYCQRKGLTIIKDAEIKSSVCGHCCLRGILRRKNTVI